MYASWHHDPPSVVLRLTLL